MSKLNLRTYRTETTTKKWKTKKTKKQKNGYAQKYQLVWGIRGVSLEERKDGYGGKDLQKRKVLAWNERVRG